MCGHEWEFFILNWRLCTKQKRKIQQKKIIPAPTSPSITDCDVEHYKCIYRTTAIYLILNRWNMFYSGKNATLFRSIVEMLAIVSEINNFWLDVNNFISNSHLQNDQPFTFKNHSITMNTEKENRILTNVFAVSIETGFSAFFPRSSISYFNCDLLLCSHTNCNLTNE